MLQSLNEIFKQNGDVPILLIHKMVIIYKIDTDILFKEKQRGENIFINNYIQSLDINTKALKIYIKNEIIEAEEEA